MKKKNIIFLSVSLVLIILLGVGVSYSMWNVSVSQDTNNTAYTECFDVSISSSKNNIDLENAYPITDESGKKLTPFSFTITNTCDIFASYTVNLENLKDTTLSSKYLKAMVNNEEIKKLSDYEPADTVNVGSIESHILAKGSLGSGDSEDYTLRLWIDYDTTMDDLDNEVKLFKSKIVVKAQPSTWNPVNEGYVTLHDAILANEYQTSPEMAIKKIEAKGTPDFSQTAPIIIWEESVGINGNTEDIKIAESEINSDKSTSNLTKNDTLMTVYLTKSYDKERGMYLLSNSIKVDPTTLDFNDGKHYYYQYEALTYNQITGKILSSISSGDISIYEILGANKENTTQIINNKEYNCIKYLLSVKTLNGKETESDKSDKGLFETVDNYGLSYYYRGNVQNNNAYFAGVHWQIVRINGDGSIRLLYNEAEKNIGLSAYNINYNYPAYIGYMYGNDISNLENSLKNEKDSTIKEKVDNWYQVNILNKNLAEYVSSNGFCNDRSIYTGDGYSIKSNTYYSSYKRYLDSSPTLLCTNDNDFFTTKNDDIGNKSLTYPIGLITYDELAFAGNDYLHLNKMSWTYSEVTYHTMTPSYYYANDGKARTWNLRNVGNLYHWNTVDLNLGIRPVISLKSNVRITGGIGTTNDPFVIDTN